MKVFFGLEAFEKRKKIVATIGTFDGVHLGHKKLLKNVVEQSRAAEAESLLLTFYPHPRMVLFPENNDLKLLNSQDEKIELLQELGIDNLVIHPFTREFSRLSSTEFVRDILVNQIGIHKLIIGYDHHFGRNREGSFTSLSELANLFNFELDTVSAEEINDINVSSTKIRNALISGDVHKANQYLSYAYSLFGTVIKGQQIGRTIGYPTANVDVDYRYKLIPADGAYAVKVQVDETWYHGMLNIGVRPTVNQSGQSSVEVHIFDFDESLYGQQIKLEFVKRIRDEKKFANTQELVAQLQADERECRAILA